MFITLKENPEVAERLNKDIAVLVFTYWKQNGVIEHALEKIREVNLYTVVSYNHVEGRPINPKVYDISDMVVTTHKTIQNVNFPWIWHMKNSVALVKEMNFKYIFFMCGDSGFGRPDRINDLPERLGDYDIISYWYNDKGAIGTHSWFVKMPALIKIYDAMIDGWNKFGNPTGSVGIKLGRLTKRLGITVNEYEGMTRKMWQFGKASPKSWYREFLDLNHLGHKA